jgi:maleate isomerase
LAIRLGMLTPSSNIVLEPMVQAMLQPLGDATAHFARFRVTEITLSEAALGQFDPAPLVAAAELLADANVQAVAWNGTSGGWLGLEADRELCRRIIAGIGIPATTSSLALAEALERRRARRIGWVTPYLDDIQARIVATFAAEGFACAAERHLGDRGNFSFAAHAEATIAALAREVASARPDAIAIYCTNFRGTRLAAPLEAELGIPVYDSIAVAVWKSLELAGADPRRIRGWGSLFEM